MAKLSESVSQWVSELSEYVSTRASEYTHGAHTNMICMISRQSWQSGTGPRAAGAVGLRVLIRLLILYFLNNMVSFYILNLVLNLHVMKQL